MMIVAVLFSQPAVAQSGRKPVALLVSNSVYHAAGTATFANHDDLDLLAKTLANLGFVVSSQENINKKPLEDEARRLVAQVNEGQNVLVFFSGMIIEVAGQPFLIMSDADIHTEADAKTQGFDIDSFLEDLQSRGAAAKIVILDASTSNPFEKRFRDWSPNVVEVISPVNTLSFYTKEPKPPDGAGRSGASRFMLRLVEQLRQSRVSAEDAFVHARIAIAGETEGGQNPLVTSSLVHPFLLGDIGKPGDDHVAANRPASGDGARASSSAATIQPARVDERSPTEKPTADKPDKSKPAEPARILRDCPDCPEMVVLGPAEYKMGSGTSMFDRPAHHVSIAKPFAIALTEVTFGSWRLCVTQGGCKHQVDGGGYDKDNFPVVNVSWSDAKDYAAWLTRKTGHVYRLPSEAEWEYAARGDATSAYSWGAAMEERRANCDTCGAGAGLGHATPVKSFPANKYGLYDMAGNAAEWVEDCWNATYRNAPTDGSAWEKSACEERVQRGGSFASSASDVKPTARFHYDADVAYYANGFRLVREVTPADQRP